MHAKGLAELALKVWGVMLIVETLMALPGTLWMSFEARGSDPQSAIVYATQIAYLLNLLVKGVGGVVILVWADSIVAWFEADTTPLQIETSTTEVQTLSLALVGVYLAVGGLQNLAASAYAWFTTPVVIPGFEPSRLSNFWQRQGEALLRAGVQFAAGVLLVFGRETIVRAWTGARGMVPSAVAIGDGDDTEDETS